MEKYGALRAKNVEKTLPPKGTAVIFLYRPYVDDMLYSLRSRSVCFASGSLMKTAGTATGSVLELVCKVSCKTQFYCNNVETQVGRVAFAHQEAGESALLNGRFESSETR